jgi:hypothetical protein
MPHVPDSHADHDPLAIAAFAAGDATGTALDDVLALVASCPDCAALHHDLRAIAAALPALPAPVRTRDFRLAPEQAASLRPAGWRRLLAPLAGPRFAFAGPLGTGLATLGIAGLLVAGSLGAPVAMVAPAADGGAAGDENASAMQAAPEASSAASAAPAEMPTPAEMPAPSGPDGGVVGAGVDTQGGEASPDVLFATGVPVPEPTAIPGEVAGAGPAAGPAESGRSATIEQPAGSPAVQEEMRLASPDTAPVPVPVPVPLATIAAVLLVAGVLLGGGRLLARRVA